MMMMMMMLPIVIIIVIHMMDYYLGGAEEKQRKRLQQKPSKGKWNEEKKTPSELDSNKLDASHWTPKKLVGKKPMDWTDLMTATLISHGICCLLMRHPCRKKLLDSWVGKAYTMGICLRCNFNAILCQPCHVLDLQHW